MILNSKGEYNRCRLPRLVIEHQEEEERCSPEPTNEEVTELWQYPTNRKRGAEKRGRRRGRGETQTYSKKMKLETKHIARTEGIEKRKSYQNKRHFEADCKRMRPDFTQYFNEEEEEEQEAEVDSIPTRAGTVSKTAPKMFSIFENSFSKLSSVKENLPRNRNPAKKKSIKYKPKVKLPLKNAQITKFFKSSTHPEYGDAPPQNVQSKYKANPAATTHPDDDDYSNYRGDNEGESERKSAYKPA